MTDHKAENRNAAELEAKARVELLRRLKHPLRLLEAASGKEKAKRRERVEAVREYRTVDEVQDAYGYGQIDDYTRRALIEAIEAGDDYIDNSVTPVELAFGLLRDFASRLTRERQSFEFELLPTWMQAEILKEREERQQEVERRKKARSGEEAAP